MANIDKELNQIKNAVYGKEVRGSIHDGLEKMNEEVESSTEKSEDAYEVTRDILDETFDSTALSENFAERFNDEIENLQPEWTQFKEDTNEQLAETPNVINIVRKYGAVGDGVTNNTSFLDNAFSSMKDGEILYLPHGTYK